MSTKLIVSALSAQGPKATAISFVKNDEGIRPWAWLANELTEDIVPGSVLLVEEVRTGKVETTYTDKKTGLEVELKSPKIQLFLGGEIEVTEPEVAPMKPVAVKASSQAKAYAEAYRARAAAVADPDSGDGAPF
jgi:hypothetical protein